MSLKGDAKKPELAKLLCENSGTDVEWLVDKFNLDLSLVARLGYHHRRSMHRMCLRQAWKETLHVLEICAIEVVRLLSWTFGRTVCGH